MFYSYGLSFDRASSLSYSRTLSATSAATPAVTTRTNGVPLTLRAAITQVICGTINPFSLDFSSDFGGGPGYVLVTVNKLLHAVGTQTGFLVEPPTRFNIHSKSVTAASAEAAALRVLHLALFVGATFSPESAGLLYVRPWHVIQAAKTPNIGGVLKAIAAKRPSTLGAVASIVALAAHYKSLAATSSESFALIKPVARAMAVLSGQVADLRRSTARLLSSTLSEAASLPRFPGKVLQAVDAEVAHITRGLPWRINMASSESARLSFNGNLLARSFGAVSAPAAALQRGLAVLRATVGTNAAHLTRAAGKPFAVSDASAAALLKAPQALRGATDSQAVASVRQTGMAKRATSAAVQALQMAAAHISVAFAVIASQAAGSFAQRLFGRPAAAHHAMTAALALSALRTLLRSVNAASTQAGHLVRGMSTSVSATTSVAQRLVRSIGLTCAAASTSLAGVLLSGLHHLLSGVASDQMVMRVASITASKSATSTEKVALLTQRGLARSVASVGIASLRRVIGKLAFLFTPESPAIGKGDSKIVGTISPSAARAMAPRAVSRFTSQGQVTQTVTYYHFYVATWAYQQTSLLPPRGGIAEPPSFGPIDPADQTIFAFDWTSRAYPNDTIVSAAVTCVPPYLPFLPGSLFVSGNLVEITVPPFPEPTLPTAYSLRCTARFASGRVSSFSIPVPVRIL